jgi:hypothetical protein
MVFSESAVKTRRYERRRQDNEESLTSWDHARCLNCTCHDPMNIESSSMIRCITWTEPCNKLWWPLLLAVLWFQGPLFGGASDRMLRIKTGSASAPDRERAQLGATGLWSSWSLVGLVLALAVGLVRRRRFLPLERLSVFPRH